ncbi:M20/M25/M40 family metallo-hydrolase [Saccharopolyspora phatthalungensis]|uniref:Acetylornithine deacetylase/succinyl-diaminopimelate desuccinylase-like protein n=1 Tax=Saccharopolyspora phatthalungensis TaxID=664693 RepID=A0A840QJU1_9PSEU|nr:M20/M25/M40 family metallo-hydrolase [Saccharopolyspora phatthalungensis]MBB5158303.1 acetylornithine deacetylase/succinyl-diaminopimelate desuccinylase-like protein [Saccharopolyspora phatthalungensis]
MLPGEDPGEVLAGIDAVLRDFNAAGTGARARIAECAPSTGGPSETPTDAPFVRACREALVAAGADGEPGGLTVNCDMTHFRSAGVPALVCGPGLLEVMHAVDEYIAVGELRAAVGKYRGVFTHLLSPGSTWWQ